MSEQRVSEEIVVGTQLFMVKSSSYRRISVETEHVTVQKVGRKVQS